MKIIFNILLVGLCFYGVVLNPQQGQAQESNPVNVEEQQDEFISPILYLQNEPIKQVDERIRLVKPDVELNNISSLFFTPSEQSLVSEARLGYTARPPTDSELRQAERGNVPKGPRELSLGGIIYASAGDWTIWLNGQKVTPKRLPPEVLDIKVRKDSIKLKWFDAYTNQIFPVKLRTHQRFNIDTRIFLPGEGVTQ